MSWQDDNIHPRADDSIVAVRARADAAQGTPFAALSGEATLAMQGLVLVRTPTLAPIQVRRQPLLQPVSKFRNHDSS